MVNLYWTHSAHAENFYFILFFIWWKVIICPPPNFSICSTFVCPFMFLRMYQILYIAESIYRHAFTYIQLSLSLYSCINSWKQLPISTGGTFTFCRIQCQWRKAVTAAGHLSLWGNQTSNCRLILHCQSSWLVPAQDWRRLGGSCRFIPFIFVAFSVYFSSMSWF